MKIMEVSAEVQEYLVGISCRTLHERKLVKSMGQVLYFNAVNFGVIVEGLGMIIWLVGHQVAVLVAIKNAIVTLTL